MEKQQENVSYSIEYDSEDSKKVKLTVEFDENKSAVVYAYVPHWASMSRVWIADHIIFFVQKEGRARKPFSMRAEFKYPGDRKEFEGGIIKAFKKNYASQYTMVELIQAEKKLQQLKNQLKELLS
jgi:hypothetical protein